MMDWKGREEIFTEGLLTKQELLDLTEGRFVFHEILEPWGWDVITYLPEGPHLPVPPPPRGPSLVDVLRRRIRERKDSFTAECYDYLIRPPPRE